MEKGNCGDIEVAHICSKTCNVLSCNQQVRKGLLLIKGPHTLNLKLSMFVHVTHWATLRGIPILRTTLEKSNCFA